MRRIKNNQSQKRIPWVTIVSLGCICAVLYVLIGQVFIVKQVTCSIEGSSCPELIQKELTAQLLGSSLFFSDHQQQVTSLQLSQPIELVNIQKRLPAVLVISFSPTKPAYFLQIAESQYLVDTAGRMSTRASAGSSESHQIVVYGGQETGIQADNIVVEKYHQFILDLLHELDEHRITVSTIEIVDIMKTRITVADDNVYIMDTTNPAQQVQKIEYIRKYLQTNTIEISAPFEIDVRFRQPVLRSRQ